MDKESSRGKIMDYFGSNLLNKKSKLRKKDSVSNLQNICKTIEEIIPNTEVYIYTTSKLIAVAIRVNDANQKKIGHFQVEYSYVEEEKQFKFRTIHYFLENEKYTLTQWKLLSNLILMTVEDLI